MMRTLFPVHAMVMMALLFVSVVATEGVNSIGEKQQELPKVCDFLSLLLGLDK